MKKFILLIAAGLLAAMVPATAQLKPYRINVGEFHELKVVDGINVDYHCDPSKAGIVEFEADPSVASAVMFDPSTGRLTVQLASRDTPYKGLPTVHVYSSYLHKVSNEGDSLVRVMTVAPGAQFNCRVIGNGTLSVRDAVFTDISVSIISGHGMISIVGKAQNATLKVTGAGQIQADELEAKNVSCSLTGTGSIHCYATQSISYGGLASGTIYYRGTPELKKRFMSNVKITPID